MQKVIEGVMKGVDPVGGFSVPLTADALIDKLNGKVVVDMEEQACNEALAGLNAYYKVHPHLAIRQSAYIKLLSC